MLMLSPAMLFQSSPCPLPQGEGEDRFGVAPGSARP